MKASLILENVLNCGLDELCIEDIENITTDLSGAFIFSGQDEMVLGIFSRILKSTQKHLEKHEYKCGQPGTDATKLHDCISLALHSYQSMKEKREIIK